MTSESQSAERFVRFGGFSFDRDAMELYYGGEKVSLQPKPARLLSIFLSRPGLLITPEEIKQALWTDRTVEFEQRIRSTIKDIRAALGDDSNQPTYIETVSRRGYRFVAPVHTQHFALSGKPSRSLLWGLVAVVIAGVALFVTFNRLAPVGEGVGTKEPRVLAIMPLRRIDLAPSARPRVEAWTHELIASAANLDPGKLIVIGRTSVSKFDQRDYEVSEVVDLLGADLLLETSVWTEEQTTRGSTTLIDTTNGQVLWSTNFPDLSAERETGFGQIFAGLSSVVGMSEGLLPPAPNRAIASAAYDALVGGRYLARSGAEGGTERALAAFDEALRLQPDYAEALVEKARMMSRLGTSSDDVIALLEQAISIDPTLASAHYMTGWIRFFDLWQWSAAEEPFRKAVELDPGRPRYRSIYATFLRASGRFAEAAEQSDLLLRSDPISELVIRDTSYLLMATGQYDEAIRLCQRALTVGLANPTADHLCLMLSYLGTGKAAKALEQAFEVMTLAGAEIPLSNMTDFWRWQISQPRMQGEAVDYFALAAAHAMVGEEAAAIETLEKALGAHSFGMPFLLGDVRFKGLHTHPDFQRIARSVGIPNAG